MNGSPCSIVVLVSGRGSNLQALMEAIERGAIHGRIAAVIGNRPGAYALERARRAGVTERLLDHRGFPCREDFDRALAALIDEFSPQLVVMAGFMRILTPAFIAHFRGRMLNIHPSLLPAFPGLRTHERAIAAGVAEHGATVHFVTDEVDGGPPVIQARVPVKPHDSPQTLAARVLAQEHRIFPEAVAWFCSGRLHLADGLPRLDGRTLEHPLQRAGD